ncbi:helix-turn-helix domain-containing protein [Sphingomonas sp. RB3P16]|uniref:helix-turn-helix domain-containing protein n=1 Tax=Parasphingomonas frigoris TaxID=3096163 RepID=UPI003FA6C09D
MFTLRVRARVGETPIGYLTRWRMMLATDRLASGREPLGSIANALGYGSENAFNTAFRREMGFSPRRYARTKPIGSGFNVGAALERSIP